jgi:hypothetical protein
MPKETNRDKISGPDCDPEGIRKKTQAVIDLHIARRTLMIYPKSHEQVKRSIVRAYKSLINIINANSTVTLAVMKDHIRIGDQLLGDGNIAVKNLARVLKHYKIATVTFRKGIEIKEFALFLQLICIDRNRIMAKGGADALARRNKFRSIVIQSLDYSKLQVTDEEKIHRISGADVKQESVWQQFVSNLMVARTDEAGRPFDPVHLAGILNNGALDLDEVVGHYSTVLAEAEVSQAGRGKFPRELPAFRELIKELNSELKAQFLSATFDNYGQVSTMSDAAQLIKGLGGDLIIQMLRQASSQDKKISPSLLAFIKRMGSSNALEGAAGGAGAVSRPQNGLSMQKVESLLAHEKYDTYVDKRYGKMLDDLTRKWAPVQSQDSQVRTLAQDIEADLTQASINTHVGRAIISLMAHSQDIAGYRDWGRQMTYLLDDLLECGAYGYLSQVIDFMRREKRNEDKQRAQIAGLVLDRFSDPQFVAKAIETVPASMEEVDPEAVAFFMELGEPVVVEIFDGLDPYQTFHEPGVLPLILRNLTSLTVKEALQRTNGPNPDYVRRMVRIIRKMGDSESAQQVRLLIDHKNFNVRMEALATLLQHNSKWGLVYLREFLDDPLAEAFVGAAGLAGRYRVKSAVPQLEAIAAQRIETELREAAIRALGKIGDPRAVGTLAKIARRRWSMPIKKNRYLRRVVFDSLDGYPKETIRDLLHYGLKQKDDVVRAACKRLLQKGVGKIGNEDGAIE